MEQEVGPGRDPHLVVAPAGRAADGLVSRLEDVATLACHGVPGCDDVAVAVISGDGVVTVGATSAAAGDLQAAQLRFSSGPGLAALKQGRAVLVEDYRLDRRWPHVSRAAGIHGVRSTLALPLLHGDAVVGALNLHGRQPSAFGQSAGRVARVLARQAAAAIADDERGRRTGAQLAVQRLIAQTLQRALVPVLPAVPGVVSAGRCFVAEGSVEVGGDWYDVFPVPYRAIGLAIGDVMGHGIGAAHAMSQVRTALRVCAHDTPSPAAVLDRLDLMVQAFELPLTTAVYGTLALRPGGAELRFCNAGHPAPLVRWPDGRVTQLDGGASWLLGGPTAELGPRRDAVVQVPAGSILVLFTDGLVERRGRHLDHGVGLVRRALAGAASFEGPDRLCDRLINAVCDDGCSDDLALLAVQVC